MATLKKGSLFPAHLAKDIFDKVKGSSALARLSGQRPMEFNGTDVFVFNFANEVSIVGESAQKPAGDATLTKIEIRPLKVVYQSRVSEEFLYATEAEQIEILSHFADGFQKKIAKGLDLMAIHGVNPATGSSSAIIGNNYLDYIIPAGNKVIYGHDSTAADFNIEEALAKVEDADWDVTGVLMAPAVRSDMAGLTANGARKYPDYAFGAIPASLGGATLAVSSNVSANSNADRVIVGDFANAFRWGFVKNLPLEIIQYGDPDGGGDLKRSNEIVIRSEAYIGWGFLNADAFASVYTNP